MSGIVVIGAQWGDEGKGKVIDYLAEKSDYVVRFQGGNNAGHTLVVGNETRVMHLVPSGILQPGTLCVISSGVVVDPQIFIDEIDALHADGIDAGPKRLRLSSSASVILAWHRAIDQAREARAGDARIGTTGRGIGPAYEDLVGRRAVFARDLDDEARLRQKLEALREEKDALLTFLGGAPVDVPAMLATLLALGKRIAPYVDDTARIVNDALIDGKRVLFEGAQGTLLDVMHGSYPYVTSSHTVAAGACIGAGIGPTRINRVLGVVKAYTTRVGGGPFPTELDDATGVRLLKTGNEYGATTGRPRRTGWLDMVVLRYATRINGMTGFFLNKLDVLSGLEKINICTAYEIDGKRVTDFPTDVALLERAKPLYETVPGWTDSLKSARAFDEMPPQARDYVTLIESELNIPAYVVSVGPARDESILMHKLW